MQRSPALRMDTEQMRASEEEFSGWQDDTFSPAVAAAKAARQGGGNPNDISAPRDGTPAPAQQS